MRLNQQNHQFAEVIMLMLSVSYVWKNAYAADSESTEGCLITNNYSNMMLYQNRPIFTTDLFRV